MSIRVWEKANRNYIEKLLDEMQDDSDFSFEINVDETRKNGTITMITITARQIEPCNF